MSDALWSDMRIHDAACDSLVDAGHHTYVAAIELMHQIRDDMQQRIAALERQLADAQLHHERTRRIYLDGLSAKEKAIEYRDGKLSAMKAQLAEARAGAWQPVEDGATIKCGCGNSDCDVVINVKFGLVTSFGRHMRRLPKATHRVYLPDEWKVCELAPAAPAPITQEALERAGWINHGWTPPPRVLWWKDINERSRIKMFVEFKTRREFGREMANFQHVGLSIGIESRHIYHIRTMTDLSKLVELLTGKGLEGEGSRE